MSGRADHRADGPRVGVVSEGQRLRSCLWMIPNTLDFGVPPGASALPDVQAVVPLQALQVAARLQDWVAENAKTARAFLKRVDAVVPLTHPLQSIRIRELPRPIKGRGTTAGNPVLAAQDWLKPALSGADMGLISEAGLPAVADPGAELVRAAHEAGVTVRPLSGPSSLMMALSASGLNGQSFAFVGYLPTQADERLRSLRELEAHSGRWNQTQIAIETPYRNTAMLEALKRGLQPQTRLAVAIGLTLPSEAIWSASVSEWRKSAGRSALPDQLPSDVPAVFLFLAR